MEGTTSTPLRLRLADAGVTVLGEHCVLDIPSRCAERSSLLTELREQLDQDSEAEVPLQLSLDELKAWLACAEHEQQGGTAAGTSCSADDDTLLRACKASDFLQDDATHATVADALGQALLGDTMHSGRATESQRARAHKISEALPAPSLLAIIGTLHKRHGTRFSSIAPRELRRGFQQRFKHALEDLVVALLRLLPRHHPAIIQSCYLLPDDPQACVISGTVPDADFDPDPRDQSHEQVFQLVAAAAPLAGGSYDHACRAPAGASDGEPYRPPRHVECRCAVERMHRQQAAQFADEMRRAPLAALMGIASVASEMRREENQPDQSTPEPSGQSEVGRVDVPSQPPQPEPAGPAEGGDGAHSAESGCEWRQAAEHLTRLQLTVPEAPRDAPPRWCTALGQLRTLRSLVVDVHGPLCVPVCEFTAALQNLPALEDLCVAYHDEDCQREAPMGSPGPRLLLEGLVKLTQLSSLELDGCYVTSPFMGEKDCVCTAPAIARLSQLSQLTRLRYAGMAVASDCTRALAESMKRLPALQELHICFSTDMCVGYMPHAKAAAKRAKAHSGLLMNLFQGSGLTSLERLAITLYPVDEISYRAEVDLHEFRERLRTHNPALLARLTALRFGPGLFGHEPVGSEAAALIADMPALRSLTLPYLCRNIDHDEAFLLADAQGLSEMPAVGVHGRQVFGPGIFAVLNSLLQRSVAERQAVCELDISGNIVESEYAAALADLLRQFGGLQKLGMRRMGLGQEGLEAVLKAVAAMPRLRALDAEGNLNCPCSLEQQIVTRLSAGLEHVDDLRLCER